MFAQKRIDFCGEYVKRYKDKSDLNIGGMKRAIADSYFIIGNKDKVNRLGLGKHWESFREEAFKEIAVEWCKQNDVPYI